MTSASMDQEEKEEMTVRKVGKGSQVITDAQVLREKEDQAVLLVQKD